MNLIGNALQIRPIHYRKRAGDLFQRGQQRFNVLISGRSAYIKSSIVSLIVESSSAVLLTTDFKALRSGR